MRAKIPVSQVIEQICVPVTCANHRFVIVDRLFEIPLRVFLVRFCEIRIGLAKCEGAYSESKTANNGKHPTKGHPERSRGIPLRGPKAIPRGPSTPLRCARDDGGEVHFRFSISSSTSRRFSGEI